MAEQSTRQLWSLYHTASFAALAGDAARSVSLANEIANTAATRDWEHEVKRVSAATFFGSSPVETIKASILATRNRLKLNHAERTDLDAVA